MYNFKIKVAKIVIEANVIYERTKTYCDGFFTNETPTLFVTTTEQDILTMKEETNRAEVYLGREPSNLELSMYEISALMYKIVNELLHYNILFMHGSVVAYNGKAYMFTALSGTGKTTHTKLWLKNIKGSYVLNGDKPLLLFDNEKVYACGSPWNGKERYGVNEILPLEAICLLERDTTNHIEQTTLKDSLSFLLNQTILPKNSTLITLVMQYLSKLSAVNFYRLACNMEDEASIISFNKIVKKDE